MPAPKGQTLNKNQSLCSAWLEDKDRHCQNLIASVDRKKREPLLQSIIQSQVDVGEGNEELVDLHLCKRFHRTTGTHSIEPTERKSMLREILSRSPEETSNGKQSKPRQIIPTSGERLPPVKPLDNTNHAADTIATSTSAIEMCIQKAKERQFFSILPTMLEQQQVSVPSMASPPVEDDRDSAISVESSPELRFETSLQPTKPNVPHSGREDSNFSTVRLDERSVSCQATGAATAADPICPKVSSCPPQKPRQLTKVTETSTPLPPLSPLKEKEPKPQERLNTVEKATAMPITSFVAAPQMSEVSQPQKLRRSPRFAESSTAALELPISSPTCETSHTPKLRRSARIEKNTVQARGTLSRGRRISRKGMDLQHIL
ncbi:hypothetical protein B0J14DRAFT_677270 [Halenospora varia]|nr:hypothetical protein B0J14DRAFT_677270 [Halenospora varia]